MAWGVGAECHSQRREQKWPQLWMTCSALVSTLWEALQCPQSRGTSCPWRRPTPLPPPPDSSLSTADSGGPLVISRTWSRTTRPAPRDSTIACCSQVEGTWQGAAWGIVAGTCTEGSSESWRTTTREPWGTCWCCGLCQAHMHSGAHTQRGLRVGSPCGSFPRASVAFYFFIYFLASLSCAFFGIHFTCPCLSYTDFCLSSLLLAVHYLPNAFSLPFCLLPYPLIPFLPSTRWSPSPHPKMKPLSPGRVLPP